MKKFFKSLTPLQATLLLIVATTIMRIVAAFSTELTTDEAHYALYGYYLDWSYFDHPSLIGWLQAIVLYFSDSDLALRLMPILFFAAASFVLFKISLKLFPNDTPWLGFMAVVIMHSAVMLQLIGMAMLPDSPLLLLGLLVLLALHGVVTDGRMRYWLWLGLWLGLSGLSKYTAISFVITVLLALLFTNQWRQLLKPGPWLALLISLVLILPVLYWNQQHEWISFLYQLHHGTGKLSWEFKRFIFSQAGQLLVYGPLIYVFGMIAAYAGLKKIKRLGEPEQLGVMLSLALVMPLLLLFAWNSGYEMTLPHWTSFGWLALSPLTAHWIINSWKKRWVRDGVRASVVYAVLFIAVVFSQLISPWMPFSDNKNALRDLYGWGEAARKAEKLRTEMAVLPGETPKLFTANWTLASRISWYAKPSPVVVLDEKYNQFDIWYGSPTNGMRGILILWPGENAKPKTGGKGEFAECTLKEKLPIISNGHIASVFSFYACHDYRL